MNARLILENGTVFQGLSMGSTRERVCEMVFNTSMVGYQEILTDPSYAGQGIVMTYPLIGNYGVNHEDNESRQSWAEAMIVRRLCPRGSNFRAEESLDAYLRREDVTGICGVDTRAITRILREQGCMNGLITTRTAVDPEEVRAALAAYRVRGVVDRTTRPQAETYEVANPVARVALYDFGVKERMIQALVQRGCQVTVFPARTPAEVILRGGFDGVMLSNGPGDPQDCPEIIAQLRLLYDAGVRIFAVCLGHQLLALATGAQTEKMKYGHRGGNHPVRDLATGRVYITSQNHGYMVCAGSVDPAVAAVSHVNANDGTVEGLRYCNGRAFTVQFHPEAAPGPADTGYLFDQFITLMGGCRHA